MFYTYRQNSSGGSFIVDDNITINVIIEADNAEQANKKAKAIGIYFDGCKQEKDCPCCGDRWYRASGDGEENPEIPDLTFCTSMVRSYQYDCKRKPYNYRYNLDGTKEKWYLRRDGTLKKGKPSRY